MAEVDRIILGIDPGTAIMGYGIIHIHDKKINVLEMGVLRLNPKDDHPGKLKKIFERTLGLIDQYHPDEIALEAPFYGKNIQVMLKLGRAQGVAMAAGLYRSVPIYEYTPLKIKKAITGKGLASKEQVAAMLHHLVDFEESKAPLDATDGLAIAVCHYLQFRPRSVGQHHDTWKSFISRNPNRIQGG